MELPAAWQERLDALRELELDVAAVGSWPGALRGALLAFAFGAVVAAAWVFALGGRMESLRGAGHEEARLVDEYRRRWASSMDAAGARAARDAAAARFEALLAQLPKRTEVPALVDGITRAAAGSRLSVGKLALGEERQSGNHFELSIDLSVSGAYHDIGAFLEALARLPRILAPGDFALAGTAGDLQLDIRLHTWRQRGEEWE